MLCNKKWRYGANMEEILAMEKDVKKLILEEEKNLLNSGFTQEDITILYEALEYIAYPVIAEYCEHGTITDIDEIE